MSSRRRTPIDGVRYYFYYNPENDQYEKIAYLRGTEYKLSIKGELWTPSTSKAVSRWIRSMNENRDIPMLFRWGSIQKVHSHPHEISYSHSITTPMRERIIDSTTSPKEEIHIEDGSMIITDKDGRDDIHESSDLVVSGLSCLGCGRTYSSRSGLWKHEQTCSSLLVTHSAGATTRHNPRELGNIAGFQEASKGGIQIQNNNQNIQNINITLRDFGKENPDWLTENILYSILGNVSNAIPMMMQKKHFNEAFPENMNLRLNTKNDMNQRLQVWEGGKWRIRDSKETFYKVVIEIYDILSDALSDRDDDDGEEDTSIHPEIRKARRSQRFLDKVKKIKPLWEDFREKIESQAEGDDNEVLKDLWEDLKTFLLDRKLCIEQEK